MRVKYDELIPEIIPDVAGCPVPLAKRTFRNACVDFFKRSEAWVYRPSALTAIKGIPEVDIEVPPETRCQKILTLDFKGKKLEPTSEVLLDDRVSGWREAEGKPKVFFKLPGNRVRVSPTPKETEALVMSISVALTPSRDSTSIDEVMLEEHYEALLAGTFNRLMSMRDQPWSNPQLASAYGMQFEEAILQAKRNSKGDNTSKVRVTKYGGY